MAKSFVKGKTTEQLINLGLSQFEKLSERDQRAVVRRIAATANKRIKSLESLDGISPALSQVQRSGGSFKVTGKSADKVRSEYLRAKMFLGSKTSTIRGWKQYQRETIRTLHNSGVDVTASELERMWAIYDRLDEVDPTIAASRDRYRVLQDIVDEMREGGNAESIIERMQSRLNEVQSKSGDTNDVVGVSEFFGDEEDLPL